MTPLCEYVYQEDKELNIYTFHGADRTTVEEWIAKLDEQYFRDIERDIAGVRILLDIGEHVLPIGYSMHVLRNWTRKRGDRKPSKIAIVYEDNLLLNIISTLGATLGGKDKISFFPRAHMADALAWLVPPESVDIPKSESAT